MRFDEVAEIQMGKKMRRIYLAAMSLLVLASAPAYAADANNGKVVFGRCAICHTVQKGGANALGPNLFKITGRKAAALPNFRYCAALKNSGITWTNDKLKLWIAGPARMVPGTKMAFGGIGNTHQVDDLIAYLGTLK